MEEWKDFGILLRQLRKRAKLSQTGFLQALHNLILNNTDVLNRLGAETRLNDGDLLFGKTVISKFEAGTYDRIDRNRILLFIFYFRQKGVIQRKEADQLLGYRQWVALDEKELAILFGDQQEKTVTKPSEKAKSEVSKPEDDNRSNLPNVLSKPLQRPLRAAHFKDREEELKALLDNLQLGQIITLCGPGGVGKTALAAEAIWQLAPGDQLPERFPDGLFFHSFYHQPQTALALEKIARSFGEELRPTPAAAAQRALAGRRALLLLDGAEEADDLAGILNLCDRCAVLVTSRYRKDAVIDRQDIAPLPLDAATDLLKAWGGMRAADDSAVHRISELVGRLPLALRLIGRYLDEREENAIDYLKWLEATPLAALDQSPRQLESVPLLLTRSLERISEQAQQVLAVVGALALAPFT